MGVRAGLLLGVCWFGSIALIDRSGSVGHRPHHRAGDCGDTQPIDDGANGWVAGPWASLAFLSGGLPPLVVIALAVVVMGRTQARFSIRLDRPPARHGDRWSVWTSIAVSPELCATALALPFTQKPAWFLGLGVLALGLPFSPFALLALARSTRDGVEA